MLYQSKTSFTDRSRLETFPVPTLDDLRKRVKVAGAGNRWKPQRFIDLANTIAEVGESRGLTVAAEHYDVSSDGFDVFACMRFESPVPGREDMRQTLGWRMSNLQRFKLLGVSGAHVMVCSNMCIIGDFVFGHKMSKHMDRFVTIDEGIQTFEEQQKRLGLVYETMERVELPRQHDVDHVLMEAVRGNVIAPSQLRKIDVEFHSDRSMRQFGERPTVRRLYEAVTEVGKTWGSPRVVERGLRGFPDMALRLYGNESLADELGNPSL